MFFDFPISKSFFVESIVPKLKESLLQTLKHFMRLSGIIVHPLDSSRPYSRFVVGDSVSLTIAECMKDFNHLTGNHPRVADELYACVPNLPPATHSTDAVVFPVLAVQVTLFPDHGICLGFSNHHAIGDSSSIVPFMKAWASVNKFGIEGLAFVLICLVSFCFLSLAPLVILEKIYATRDLWYSSRFLVPLKCVPYTYNEVIEGVGIGWKCCV
ncbi:malonyl-coenzyme:anthocyanin 5-O-glucoside-6'''-O-malonyltransferase-like isoform X1 [Henckelia pumila]|uniref:malonyl-coenzyme:anthocyanin 5-O-glucoside-6'''-O-malonyltransferase-like isoform X1 n=2 Tax=Henckelia pumila TaxID=405737 RepID=UPI003C6DEB79